MTQDFININRLNYHTEDNYARIKSELTDLLDIPEARINAAALLALLFGEVHSLNTEGENPLTVIINAEVQNPSESAVNENILIYKDKILAFGSDMPFELPNDADGLYIINAEGMIISPGLIDQHIHGGYGCDFNVSEQEEIVKILKNLPKNGITSIIPTVMTASEDIIKRQIQVIKTVKENTIINGTRILGIHLEGPYLSQEYKGIQPESYIIKPDVESFKRIEDPEIKILSYAPELDEGFKLTRYLSDKGIIPSAGHSKASHLQIREAVNFGLKHLTHLFNAMTPLHHREPGIIGEGLVNDDLAVEIIADGVHLDPVIIELVLRIKPDSKVVFISDSLPLNSAECSCMDFGGQMVYKKENMAVNESGTMAGSLKFLDYSAEKLSDLRINGFSKFIRYSSQNIAQNIGRDDLGFIAGGMKADLVFWSKEHKVLRTIISGKTVFKSE